MNQETSILDINLQKKVQDILEINDGIFLPSLIRLCQKIRQFYLIVIASVLINQVTLSFAWVTWADFFISLILGQGMKIFHQKATFNYLFDANYYLLKILFLLIFLFFSCLYQFIKICQTTLLIHYMQKNQNLELKILQQKFNQVFKGVVRVKSDKYKHLYLVSILLYGFFILSLGFIPVIWKASVAQPWKEYFDSKLAVFFN